MYFRELLCQGLHSYSIDQIPCHVRIQGTLTTVLARLEEVCHDHAMMMCVRSDNSETEVSGHAMMMSCPPPDHVHEHPDVVYPHKAPELPAPDLMRLYDLSQKLPLGGEITPVQALQLIRAHERYGELTTADFEVLKKDLREKSRCYGSVVPSIPLLPISPADNLLALGRYWRSSRCMTHSTMCSRPNSAGSISSRIIIRGSLLAE